MDVEITPEPSDAERQAILEALTAEEDESRAPSPWRRAGLEGSDPLGSDPFSPEPGCNPRVVQSRNPGQDDRNQ